MDYCKDYDDIPKTSSTLSKQEAMRENENFLVLRPLLVERAIVVKRAVNMALKEQLYFHSNDQNKKRTSESSRKKTASNYILIETVDTVKLLLQ